MPYYTFRDKKTDKEHTLEMKMAEREPYLKANPNLEQIFNAATNVGDPWHLGRMKLDKEFEHGVIERMRESIPENTLKDRKLDIRREH